MTRRALPGTAQLLIAALLVSMASQLAVPAAATLTWTGSMSKPATHRT